mgnify:FL=1
MWHINSKIIVKNIVIIVIFCLILGYSLYQNYFSPDSKAVASVVITDEGFMPERITVEKGTTVTWINEGDRPHWPASNFHPVHSNYPELGGCLGSKFDACRGLQKGESFSFKLNQVGIWPMHDHLFPGLTMIVEVVEDKDSVKNTSLPLGDIDPATFRNLPYSEQLGMIKDLAQKDPEPSWSCLKRSVIKDGQVVRNAHEFAHIIGNELYKSLGLDGIRVCDTSFAFGCMHGVTEKMLLKEGIGKIKSIETQCISFFPPEETQDYTGCIHGMGHGVYTFEGGNLKKALANCDIVSDPYRQSCYDGVFMENSTSQSRNFDPANPWKFCSDLDGRYQRNCARYQSQIFLNNSANAPDPVFTVGVNCSQGPSDLLKNTCYESLGYYISQTNLGNVENIWRNCQKMPDKNSIGVCATGGAVETVFQKYNDYRKASNEICSRLALPEKNLCFERIKIMIN